MASSIAVSEPVHGFAESRSGRRPDVCVMRCRIVMSVLPCRSKPGTNVDTRSLSLMRPSSTSFITLVVVATTLVSDARSKIVSSVIGSGAGSTARRPIAF